jgi:hypothetical protein
MAVITGTSTEWAEFDLASRRNWAGDHMVAGKSARARTDDAPKMLAPMLRREMSLMADTVEKGKNEPIEIFACAPVETDSS